MQRMMQRYTPAGFEEITRPGLPGVVYVDRARLCAQAYRGRAVRPTWNYLFRTSAQMEQEIERFFLGLAAREEEKRKRAEERRAYVPALKPGDVLHTHWGYEQTNVEFFEVVAVKGKRVTVREVAGSVKETGHMCGITRPVRGEFVGEPITRTARPGDEIRIDDVRYAWPLGEDETGSGIRCSWYY